MGMLVEESTRISLPEWHKHLDQGTALPYYGGIDITVFLLTVFSKGQRVDLTQRERNGLAQLTRSLVPSLGPRFKI